MLKLIPQERPDRNGTPKASKRKKHSSDSRTTSSPKLQQKYNLELEHQKKVLKVVGYKLMNMAKNDNPAEGEVSEMIHGLQKSIICLQKQRQKSIREKRRKK